MGKKIFFFTLVIATSVILQISFFSAIPYLRFINFALLAMILFSIKYQEQHTYIAIFSGTLLDVYSSYTFGVNTLAMLVVSFANNYIYFNILTNRRLLALILLVATDIIIYQITINLSVQILIFLKLNIQLQVWSKDVALNALKECAAAVITVATGYIFYRLYAKKVRGRFFTSEKI